MGAKNKVYKSDDEITESQLPEGQADELVKKGFLEEISEEEDSKAEGAESTESTSSGEGSEIKPEGKGEVKPEDNGDPEEGKEDQKAKAGSENPKEDSKAGGAGPSSGKATGKSKKK